MCLNADTGKLLWEHRLNIYESDVPPRRIAWSSPVGDPATGNIYVFGACNELTALSNDGKVLWSVPWQTSYDVNAATPGPAARERTGRARCRAPRARTGWGRGPTA